MATTTALKNDAKSTGQSVHDSSSSVADGTNESLSTAKENTKSVLDDAKESATDISKIPRSTIESAKDLTHNAVTELTKIPTNLRDYFFSDPHFELSWEHYDKIKEHILGVSADLWHKFDHQLRSLSYTPPAEQGEVEIKEYDQKTNTPFPRYWMLPSFPELKTKVMNLNLFQEVDNELIRFKEDDTSLEVSLDTHNFKPDEINVTVDKGILYILGKHEDISENKKHITVREFRRMYTLPEGMGKDDVVSNLSTDGILVVTAKSQKAL